MRISRLEWFYHPILAKRRAFPPPKLPALPALSEEFPQRRGEEQTGGDFWRLERELLHGKKSSSLTNGFRKQGKSL
jgi:hypothetical protein